MEKPDILIFMSDQHTPYYSGFYGGNVDTPNLDSLCRQGVQFTEAYTVCPLCVPARMSMLSVRRPSTTGVFTNLDTLPDMTPTFLHNLVEMGYETVLAGRMHFIGNDQRHGFMRRIGKEITPVTWNRPTAEIMKERGAYINGFNEWNCLSVIGGGESPVNEYDNMVITETLQYLAKPHHKPQFIIVSLYAPHFPYVGPKELYEKYRAKVKLPTSFYDTVDNEALKMHVMSEADEETALGVLAAYCAAIENIDTKVGIIREAFDRFTKERSTQKIFCYISDHGDQCGDRKMFGKSTFYEKSIKIPMIFTGDNISMGLNVNTPVSIMDIGPTILELAGCKPMDCVDGFSVAAALSGEKVELHTVYAEFLDKLDQDYHYSFMVKDGKFKYIKYSDGSEMLFDTDVDPDERFNLIEKNLETVNSLRKAAMEKAMPIESIWLQHRHDRAAQLFKIFEQSIGVTDGDERWKDNPPKARNFPEIQVRGITAKN